MEQNRESINRPTHLQSNDLPQGFKKHVIRKGQSLKQMIGRLYIHRKKNKVELILHYTQTINTKQAKDLNVRPYSEKHLKVNLGQKLLDTSLGTDFFKSTSSKNRPVRIHKTRKVLYSKGNNQHNIKPTYGIRKKKYLQL